MTEKELRRLRRPHLLELLFTQGKEAAELKEKYDKVFEDLAGARNTIERLKNRLDEKDAQIRKLKESLEEKDAVIRRQQEEKKTWYEKKNTEWEESRRVAEQSLKLIAVFEAAQKEAHGYMSDLKKTCERCMADPSGIQKDSSLLADIPPGGTGMRKKKGKKPDLEMPSLEVIEAVLQKEQYRYSYGSVLRSTLFSLIVVSAAAVLIVVLVLPVLHISGTSMTETLQDGDIVVAVNSTKFRTGDVIAFYYNNDILIKRVIANAGDWVDIDDEGNVYVNEQLLNEPYISEKALGDCDIDLPCQVPDGKCFVMGDHRATSVDSRSTAIGCIGRDMILGRIWLRVWPIQRIGMIN